MFTGLIEAVCRVAGVRGGGGGLELRVDMGKLGGEAEIGESIAVNGVCLTVARVEGTVASFDVSGETLSKSALGRLRVSQPVNVERALRPTDRLGGHIVQGHVDGTATIAAMDKQGEYVDITFSAGAELTEQMVEKGSVCVDGISLTIASIDANSFRASVIPQTLEKTTLGKAKAGDVVNIETDIIGKMIRRQLERILPAKEKLTVERLRQLGF
ncbi:MAG: riboflavin synthase [Planctomycetota bacterium]|jgi:riboflavin synthase